MDNWKIAEEFYRNATREIYQNLREESGLSIQDINLVLVTENNAQIRELTLETLGVSEANSISLLKNYGNTMSAMLPLLLDSGWKSGRIQPGMNIMLISHGEGISGGGMIYKV
jgi:3-oxoacyl-[acyl-carrier-protein] synthase-3